MGHKDESNDLCVNEACVIMGLLIHLISMQGNRARGRTGLRPAEDTSCCPGEPAEVLVLGLPCERKRLIKFALAVYMNVVLCE